MDAVDIKYFLAKKGLTLAAIASELDVALPNVSQVVGGKATSRRISQAVADAIGLPLGAVFPRYADKKSRISGPNTAVEVGTKTTVPEDRPLLQADR